MCLRYNTHVPQVQYTCALKKYNTHGQEVATINPTSINATELLYIIPSLKVSIRRLWQKIFHSQSSTF